MIYLLQHDASKRWVALREEPSQNQIRPLHSNVIFFGTGSDIAQKAAAHMVRCHRKLTYRSRPAACRGLAGLGYVVDDDDEVRIP